jgi:hypothetical protein
MKVVESTPWQGANHSDTDWCCNSAQMLFIEVFKNHDKHKAVRTEPVEVPHRGMRWLGQAQPERCVVS